MSESSVLAIAIEGPEGGWKRERDVHARYTGLERVIRAPMRRPAAPKSLLRP